jgi:signal transduction histidine kinase
VLLPCAFAITVSTTLVAAVALFNVDEVSSSALALDAFRLGASAMFLAAALLRLTRWRVTTDPNSALLAAAMAVLGLLCLPLGNLVTQVVHDDLEPTVALAGRAIGTVACLALALRAMTVSDEDTTTDWARTLLTAGAVASAGLAGLVGLFAVAPTALTHRAVLEVVINLALAGTWVALGLAASRRDVKQPWAGRVAPLYASLGVVELLYALDQVQPGSWSMPAVALLSSVAMITAHASYVDLTEAVRTADRVGRRAAGLGEGVAAILSSTADASERRTDVDVTGLVNEIVGHRSLVGQEVRVRGLAGYAHVRAGDVAAALERLLVNAHTYAPRSPVTVHVVAIGRRIEVSVADRGPGMSAAAASAFGSAQVGRAGGLGLHVARALMARNGGDLELRNRIGGTTFVLSLPASEDQRTPPVVPRWETVHQF